MENQPVSTYCLLKMENKMIFFNSIGVRGPCKKMTSNYFNMYRRGKDYAKYSFVSLVTAQSPKVL